MPQVPIQGLKESQNSPIDRGHQIGTGSNQILPKSNNSTTTRKIRTQIDVCALEVEEKAQAYEVEEALETTKI